ncbi:protein tramtrack, beta isoform-like isoform X2 [Palaemon carinicauda]|uniref:protein tramtrack, beta isoform-like isoform X2 n=1 Tax=Palaemon carinicauda TaxID=392227 RepID=UPI0035B5CDD1
MEAEVLALKWNNHQSIFYHIICGLRTKSNYTDVTLACEGKFYPVHKLVLSTCSEYFSEIFDRTPCKNPVVVLKDIQCKDLEFLLDYMYIGEVNVRQNELSSLLKAAECLKVKGLAVREDDQTQTDSPKRHGSREKRDVSSPPTKRRRAEEYRSKPPDTGDFGQENSNDGAQIEESNHSSDLQIFSAEQHGETSLPHSTGDQDPIGEAENEVHSVSSLAEIKIEQDLGYEGNGNFKHNQSSVHTNYDSDQYLTEDENRIPKVENSEGDEVLDDSVMGVNFNELLQSSLKTDEFGEPHSSVHPQVNLEQQWDGNAVGRGLPSHALSSPVGAHNPLTHHQQQKAAAAALGLLHSSGSESQSPIRLLHQQHGGVATASDLFAQQQQGVMVGEGSSIPSLDFLKKKDKGQRDYVCQFCGREFGHRTNLQAHLRIHTGEKPFRCLYCPYRTALKGNLKMHTISRHKIDWKAIKHLVQPVPDEKSN